MRSWGGWVLWMLSSQFGIDVFKFFRAVYAYPAYLRDLAEFRRISVIPVTRKPCLHDRFDDGGAIKSEYFWQDLLVAQKIFNANPARHLDIGSRIDGFVAHVASFRDIEVIDIRPLSLKIPRVTFIQADMMQPLGEDSELIGKYDSVSCLHVIEHFGLGRYGDPIAARGYQQGIENLARLIAPEGMLYLSTPIGEERVEFNANWVFDPRSIIDFAKQAGLTLFQLTVIERGTTLHHDAGRTAESLKKLAEQHYALGIFIFQRV